MQGGVELPACKQQDQPTTVLIADLLVYIHPHALHRKNSDALFTAERSLPVLDYSSPPLVPHQPYSYSYLSSIKMFEVTTGDFEEKVINSKEPTLVLFQPRGSNSTGPMLDPRLYR